MEVLATSSITISIALMLAADATAYSDTPFVNAKLGETVTCPGWIVQTGGNSNSYLVLVQRGCHSEFIAFHATAGGDVVSSEQLGRPIMVSAKIVAKIERESADPVIRLDVFQVQEIAKDNKRAGG